MHIYLVRHAHALDGDVDTLRPLSKKGIAQIQSVGRLLRRADAIQAKVLWHSPLARSSETADRLAKKLRLKAKISEVSGLKPSDDPEIMAERLSDLRYPVIVVGHDPHLSALATLLLTGKVEPLLVHLKKSAVVRLDREGRGWSVRWHVSPEVI